MRSVFFILAVYMLAPSISWSAPTDMQPALTKFFLKAFTPVIGEKRTNMKYKVYTQNEQLLLVVEGQHQGLAVSRYIIRFSDEDQVFAIPKLQLVTKKLPNNKSYAQLTGEITLSAKKVLASADLTEEKNIARLLLRADPLLLPQLNAPGWPAPTKVSLTEPQQELLNEVEESITKQRAEGKAPRALIYLPTGIGKTVLAALTTQKSQAQATQQIFFVVENKEVLADATAKFIQLLGISRDETAVLTGDYDGNKIAALKNKKVVSITRTGLFNALDRFSDHLDQRHTPATFIFDEAQHLGRKDGQFDKIIATIEQHLKIDDLILGLSATPWHVETDFVRRFFSPYIFSMFLTPAEREQVLQNKDLVQLSMTMVLLAMSYGYINPIFAFDEITTVPGLEEGTSVRALLKRDEMTLSKMTLNEAADHLRKQISVHQPLLLKMLQEIVASVDRSEEHTYYWNRGLIFVPSIAHANVYAFMLNRLRSHVANGVRMEFDAYHSKLERDEAHKVMDWFKDEELRGEKHKHKYLIVVRSAGEGFDFPAINHLITAKPYNKEDQIGVRELLQNLGRATRLAPFKTQLRVTDFTGDMRRLFADLDPNLIRTFSALDITLKTPPPIIETEVVLTQSPVQIDELVTETVDVANQVANPEKPKKVKAEKAAAEPTPEPSRPAPMIVPAAIQAELESLGAKTPFEFMVRNLSKFKFEGYFDDEKRLAYLQTQLSPTLAPFFASYIRTVSGAREKKHVYSWEIYYKQLEALAKLRYPATRYSYMFQTEAPFSDEKFNQFASKFERDEFVQNAQINNFLQTLKVADRNRLRERAYLKHPIARILYIPQTLIKHVTKVEEFIEEDLLSVFEQASFSKLDLLDTPIQKWPVKWRSEMRRLTHAPSTLSHGIEIAAQQAGIKSLKDFLVQYYNEEFANSMTEMYRNLVEHSSPLLSAHTRRAGGIFGIMHSVDDFFLEYSSSKHERAAMFISLNILAKSVGEVGRINSKEFENIYFLVSELMSRAKILGIDSYLTSSQVKKLSGMSSDQCEFILDPSDAKTKREKVTRKSSFYGYDIRNERR